MGIESVGGAATVQMMSIEGMDLESMLMAVQTNRVNLLDQQLKDKMGSVQDRNNRISELNTKMTGMNQVLAGETGTDLSAANKTAFLASAPQVPDESKSAQTAEHITDSEKIANYTELQSGAQVRDLHTIMKESGYIATPAFFALLPARDNPSSTLSQSQNNTLKAEAAAVSEWVKSNGPMTADSKAVACTTKLQAEAYVKGLQSEIDALGNTQQMEMLGLQSLSNKRNEAFEIMTNFMKKFNDSRAGIIQKF